jgi:hypothetical protein
MARPCVLILVCLLDSNFNPLTYLEVYWTSAHLGEFASLIVVKGDRMGIEIAYFVVVYKVFISFLDVQNILSTDTYISRETKDHSFGNHLIIGPVRHLV